MIKTILTIIFIIICVFLSAVILLQEGKSAGLSGSIGGMADSYWGRNKSRSMEGKLEKLTKYAATPGHGTRVTLTKRLEEKPST